MKHLCTLLIGQSFMQISNERSHGYDPQFSYIRSTLVIRLYVEREYYKNNLFVYNKI